MDAAMRIVFSAVCGEIGGMIGALVVGPWIGYLVSGSDYHAVLFLAIGMGAIGGTVTGWKMLGW